MKITGVETQFVDRYLFVEVHTDAGITGLGESGAWGYLESSEKAIEKFGAQKYHEVMNGFSQRGSLDDTTLRSIIEGADDPVDAVMAIAANPAEHQRLLRLSGPARVTEAHKIAIKNATKPADVPPVRAADFDLRDRKIIPASVERSPFEGQHGDSSANDDKWYAARARQKAGSTGRPWSRK